MTLSSCSLSVGEMVLTKYTSNALHLRKFSGAFLMMVHINLWVMFSFKCLVGSYGSHHSFTDKNKCVKRNIAVELEQLPTSLDKFLDQSII